MKGRSSASTAVISVVSSSASVSDDLGAPCMRNEQSVTRGCSAGKQHPGGTGSNLDVLHGIRALACIAIVFGHCMFALGFAWPEQHPAWYSALESQPWMLALVNLSEPAMDTFLILSGFLAAGSLLPAMQSGKSPVQVVRRYYTKRLRRMLPSYYATLAFVRFAFLPTLGLPNARAPEAQRAIQTLWFNEQDGCPDKLWANFLFVNNQLQRAGCMKYAWSQAVQMQFFLLCPLLMLCLAWGVRGKSLNRQLAKAAGTIVGAVTLYRAVIALDFRLPVPIFGPLDDQRALEHMTQTLQVSYYSLLPRLTHLAFGMLSACAMCSPGVRQFLGSRKKGSGGAALLAGALLYGTLVSNRFGPAPVEGHPLNSPAAKVVGVAGITGFAQPAALTFLLCCAVLGLSQHVTRVLSWRGWRPVADASYDIYLLHPLVMYAVWTVLPPSAWFDVEKPSALKFIAVSSVVFWVSLGIARLHSKAWASLIRPQRRHCKV